MAIRSCVTPLSAVQGNEIVTIEGLSPNGTHPLQVAWRELNVPQCGYCQAGQIMNAAGLLKTTPNPSDADIDSGMSGNICRCGTYPRIRAAIKQVADTMSRKGVSL
jgi:isoquinoline 1-oxidoreductase alpha subunit